MQKYTRSIRNIVIAAGLVAAPLLQVTVASAAQITGRSIALSSSVGGASSVSYTLNTAALPTSGTTVKSVGIQFCTAATGTCTAPAGFSSSTATLTGSPAGLGSTSGWTVNTAVPGSLRIVNATNATNPTGAVSVAFAGVHNPTATNTTFYALVTTYSDAAWLSPIDTGNVALSTSAQIQVNLSVSEALTFCTGTTITGQDCGTIAGNQVNLGNGSSTATASGTSIFAASTNGASGYTVTVNGGTLTSGSDTIAALAANAASAVGTSQFGVNLVSNTTPVVGANVSGVGTATAATNYNTANSYRFVTGETVASVAGTTNANAFTVSYIANIAGVTHPGAYTTNLNYAATANF